MEQLRIANEQSSLERRMMQNQLGDESETFLHRQREAQEEIRRRRLEEDSLKRRRQMAEALRRREERIRREQEEGISVESHPTTIDSATYTKREPIRLDAFLPVGYPVFTSNNTSINGSLRSANATGHRDEAVAEGKRRSPPSTLSPLPSPSTAFRVNQIESMTEQKHI